MEALITGLLAVAYVAPVIGIFAAAAAVSEWLES
jgi:hypothetical protein